MGRIDEHAENAAIREAHAALAVAIDADEKEDEQGKTKRYLRATCAGCGGRVEVTNPQTHVVSSYTGAAYCATCCIDGLPPIDKRPEWNPVRAQSDVSAREQALAGFNSTERKQIRMSTTETETSPVFDELIERVKAEIPNVELDPRNGYVTLRVSGKTIGYVTGKKKVRIDGIVTGGNQEKLAITESSQVADGVALLQKNAALQAEKATARAAADAEKKASAKKAKAEPKAEATAEPATSEVKPDPKPATRKRTSRSRKS